MIKRLLSFVAIFTVSTSAYCELNVYPMIEFGLEGGGEKLVSTNETDLYAGGGLYIGGGFKFQQAESDMNFVLTLGLIDDDVDFEGPRGSSSFSALAINIGAQKVVNRHTFGGGLAYHSSPEWELCFNGVGCETADFDNAIGFYGQYQYSFGNNGYIGVKYTLMEYEIQGFDIDADSFGLFIGYNFQ